MLNKVQRLRVVPLNILQYVHDCWRIVTGAMEQVVAVVKPRASFAIMRMFT